MPATWISLDDDGTTLAANGSRLQQFCNDREMRTEGANARGLSIVDKALRKEFAQGYVKRLYRRALSEKIELRKCASAVIDVGIMSGRDTC